MTEKARARVIITGRVQGVFFRSETQRAAERLGVNGWVRNLPDGTVEAVFEGDRQAVEDTVAWCHQGAPMARVADVRVVWETFGGDLKGFAIRR